MAFRPLKGKRAGIQAVLLADSFMTPHRFRPMTKSMPKVLLPLVNVPMLEYTLEFLSTSNVDDVIIFAASHADQIQSYINSTRWLDKQPELSVRVVVSTESRSVGDALRYLDQLDIIKNDFLLISGDVVSNIDLNPIIHQHRLKSAENPEITVTVLFSTVQPGHAMRSRTDDLLIATDRLSNRILHYSNNIQQGLVEFNPDIFSSGHNGINIQSNAFDTGILLCNKRLLTIFSDQFDYRSVREDYIVQQLDLDPDSAIPADHIHAHFVPPGAYANRIVDMRTYHTCSHDIIRKWVSPIIVSNNVLTKTSYKSFPNNVYREDKVTLAHTTLLKADCVVGRLSKLGHSTLLHKTVVGRNVTIGDSCSLTTCYVLDGTTIGDGCVMNGTWIGRNVTIGNNVTIHKGAVLGDDVVIGDNVVVPPYISITANDQLDDEEAEALNAERMRISAVTKLGRAVDIASVFTMDKPLFTPDGETPDQATGNQTMCQLTPAQRDNIDMFPIDPRTFFYNNESEGDLALRISQLNKMSINTAGFDEDNMPLSKIAAFPRILLPSIEVLQLDSSPHQVFSKQTMTSIIQEFSDSLGAKGNDEDDCSRVSGVGRTGSGNSTLMYNQCDVAKNFSPYTNKSYEALVSSHQRKKQPASLPMSSSMDGSLTMLSPSTLQQTLTSNVTQVSQALSQKLPYYPLADLSVLYKLSPDLVVGAGGKGRLYLHPPHAEVGRAIQLLNSTAPPAYISLQSYPLLTKSQVIAETIDYGLDDYDEYVHGAYGSDDGEGEEGSDQYHDFELSDEEDDDDGVLSGRSTTRMTQVLSGSGNLTDPACHTTLQGARAFVGEVIGSMKRSLQGEKVANIIQELPTLRLVYRDVGYDVYIFAVFLGIFAMAGLPPPTRGVYRGSEGKPAWDPPAAPADTKQATLAVAKLFRVWAPTLRPANPGDPITLILPALTAACLMNPQYTVFYSVLLNQLYGVDFLPGEDVMLYHERIKSLSTLHSTAKSLLPSMVEYAGQTIVGIDKLIKTLEAIIEMLQDDDEDEDDDEDDEDE